jgi:type IV pilus assembly protein PilC
MEILKHDTADKEGQALLEQISLFLRKGNPFFQALENTGLFPDYVIRLVALGEESGNLDDVLISLAEYYEREDAVAENVKSAVTYPFIMIIMMFIVIIVLIVKVLPIFRQVFVQLGTQMSPLATSLLALGNTLSSYSLVITILFFLLIGGFVFMYKNPKGRTKLQRFLTRFPLTKEFYNKIAAARFASGMYLSITSGMDTYKSLDMISELVENDMMRDKIELCKQEMQKDSNLPEALASSGIFSNLYARMVAVGFRSGSIDLVMKQIAQSYDEETQKQLNHIISIIEPTLVIVLSFIVGLILMSVLLPLMGIMSSIG